MKKRCDTKAARSLGSISSASVTLTSPMRWRYSTEKRNAWAICLPISPAAEAASGSKRGRFTSRQQPRTPRMYWLSSRGRSRARELCRMIRRSAIELLSTRLPCSFGRSERIRRKHLLLGMPTNTTCPRRSNPLRPALPAIWRKFMALR